MTALMYHDIVASGAEDTSGFPGRDAALYKVTPETFAAHLAAIKNAHPTPAAVPITFDDGGKSAMEAAEALERHCFIGHFFITVNYIGTRGFVTEPDLRELRPRGHVIGSHSCSHPLRMGHCSWTQLREEWTRSREVLAGILGEDITVASVPGGDFTPPVAEAAAAAGFTTLFTSEPTRAARQAFGLTLVGRFTIHRWTPAATAAAFAAGEWLPCAGQALVWNAKKIGKHIAGERYLQLRKLLLGHSAEVEWGDHR
jgi:peptidoglycan/xylan/chitin deacetylase (PgdA/CDA1 family)